jgi:HSP20 family protein
LNLVRYNPHHRLSLRSNRSSSLFDGFFDDFLPSIMTNETPLNLNDNGHLKVDIYEKDDAIIIDAELPGVEKEDLSVDVKGKLITLGGERKSDQEIKEENSYQRERKYGKLERTFNLPFEMTEDKVKATFKNGILKLEIEKPKEQVTKKIDIN